MEVLYCRLALFHSIVYSSPFIFFILIHTWNSQGLSQSRKHSTPITIHIDNAANIPPITVQFFSLIVNAGKIKLLNE